MVGDRGALLGWGSSLVCGVRGRGFSLLRKVKRAVEEAPAWGPEDPLVALVPPAVCRWGGPYLFWISVSHQQDEEAELRADVSIGHTKIFKFPFQSEEKQ